MWVRIPEIDMRPIGRDGRKLDPDQRSRRVGGSGTRICTDANQRIVLLGNLAHDRQTQATAVDIGAEDPIKAIEDALAFELGDAGPGVFNLKKSRFSVLRRTRTVTVPGAGV